MTYRPLPGDQAMDHASDPGGAKSGGNGGPFRLALPLYLGLLLVTAAIGIANQDLRARQVALVSDKTVLQASVARAEVRAAAVEGPSAIARWAEGAGMVPLPEGRVAAVVAPEPAPEFTSPEPRLELRTEWR